MRWFEGSSDPLDKRVDVGRENQYEPLQSPDPRDLTRKAIAGHVEFSAMNPEDIVAECELQDQRMGLDRGTTLDLFLSSISNSH